MARLIGFPVRASGLAIIFIGLAFAMSATQATAFGGGGSRRPAQNAVPSCPSGQYYSSRCRQCAKRCRSGYVWACGRGCVQKSSLNLNDGELYAEAVSLIGAEYYAHALELLWAIEARQDPKVLNYIGFAVRKLGQVDEGIKYYHEALALDPDYTLAREYLGEGYLQKGDLAAAKAQLAEIEKRCSANKCREYTVLAQAIADFTAGKSLRKKAW